MRLTEERPCATMINKELGGRQPTNTTRVARILLVMFLEDKCYLLHMNNPCMH